MNEIEKLDDYLTVSEAARYLGVTASTLRNWDKAGKLIPYRNPMNGYRLYLQSDLKNLLKEVKHNDYYRK